MAYEILLYLGEIGFRSVLDGQSGAKSPLRRGGVLPRERCYPAMGGSRGNLENHLDQNYIKLSHTKGRTTFMDTNNPII